MPLVACQIKGDFRQGSTIQGPMNSSNLKLVPMPLDEGPRSMVCVSRVYGVYMQCIYRVIVNDLHSHTM